ncbi:expressed unknown protein [Seminavis robusta]|uniref:Uncharacterized protein n=1 Tax=Seminavis robusta TaxID=568900 RepID=A0A9N8H6Q7_9STRA|nr:expressed unknown protein [Seminavis robusta]|eukprot:Sro178_g078120.1 n/a (207) ;mRNA; r:34423-35229
MSAEESTMAETNSSGVSVKEIECYLVNGSSKDENNRSTTDDANVLAERCARQLKYDMNSLGGSLERSAQVLLFGLDVDHLFESEVTIIVHLQALLPLVTRFFIVHCFLNWHFDSGTREMEARKKAREEEMLEKYELHRQEDEADYMEMERRRARVNEKRIRLREARKAKEAEKKKKTYMYAVKKTWKKYIGSWFSGSGTESSKKKE